MQLQGNDSSAPAATNPTSPAAAPGAKAGKVEANAVPNRAQGAFGQRGQQAQAIIYDCDFGRDIDTVLALAVLSNLGTKGKLATVVDQIEHGHHVFRAYCKHAFLDQ